MPCLFPSSQFKVGGYESFHHQPSPPAPISCCCDHSCCLRSFVPSRLGCHQCIFCAAIFCSSYERPFHAKRGWRYFSPVASSVRCYLMLLILSTLSSSRMDSLVVGSPRVYSKKISTACITKDRILATSLVHVVQVSQLYVRKSQSSIILMLRDVESDVGGQCG